MITKNQKTKKYDVRFWCCGKDIRKRGFSTKRDAEDFIREKTNELKGFVSQTDNLSTLCEIYLNKRKTRIKTSTYEKDERILHKYVLVYFSYTYQITINSINKWKNEILKNNFKEHYVNQIIKCFKQFLSYISKISKIDINAIEELDAVKLYELKEEMKIWSVDDFNRFIAVVDIPFYKTLFSFLFWSGVRISELKAITKNDIIGNEVLINKRMEIKTKTGKGLTTLKTASSNRRIMLDDELFHSLNELTNEKNALLFPVSETQIRRMLDKYIKLSQVPRIRIHDFRHSHASWLIRNGCNIKIVSERLGHASADITLRYYYHLLPKEQEKVIELINKNKGVK